MKILSTRSMQEWENTALAHDATVPGLMAEAAHGCFQALHPILPANLPMLFLCGKGNNGNDGLWLAQLFKGQNRRVTIIRTTDAELPQGLQDSPAGVSFESALQWPNLPRGLSLTKPFILFDALLGLGAKGTPRGAVAEILNWVIKNKRACHLFVSIDIPSGLDADTGTPAPGTFPADFTCMIGGIKKGALAPSAAGVIGRILPIPITLSGTPREEERAHFFTVEDAREIVRPLSPGTYKNRQGNLSLLAGSEGMSGAAVLASRAGLRSGAGLIRLFVPEAILNCTASATPPEVMVSAVAGDAPLPEKLRYADAIVAGPGMGQSPTALRLLEKLLTETVCPLVLDADALNLIAKHPNLLEQTKQPVILTPHAGEMKRLLGEDYATRESAAKKWLPRFPGSILVLKGPRTIVASAKDFLSYNSTGNPGMASGGMGDVLAGVIGGLLAQGYTPWDAARLGVFWHGASADLAAQSGSELCLTASDVIEALGISWKTILYGSVA